jgi:hypothetical protein
MYDQAELTPAVITASHVALRARRTGFKASNNPRNQRISSRNVPRIQFGPVFSCESPPNLRRRVMIVRRTHNERRAACFGSWPLPRHQRRTPSNTACRGRAPCTEILLERSPTVGAVAGSSLNRQVADHNHHASSPGAHQRGGNLLKGNLKVHISYDLASWRSRLALRSRSVL